MSYGLKAELDNALNAWLNLQPKINDAACEYRRCLTLLDTLRAQEATILDTVQQYADLASKNLTELFVCIGSRLLRVQVINGKAVVQIVPVYGGNVEYAAERPRVRARETGR